MSKCYDIEPQFLILYQDGSMSLKNGPEVSRMYDLADCGHMDDVKDVLAVDEDGDLASVTVEARRWANTDEEYPFYYAYSDILAGKRRVGTVAWTDH